MPALIAPLVGFALGVALAWLARAELGHGDERAARARLTIAALYGALVFAPASAWFLLFAGDWSLAYLADGRAIPSALTLCLALLDAASVPAGFLAGRSAVRRRALRAFLALAAVPSALALGFVLALFPKLRVEGTFHQVRADFGTQPVAGGPIGWAILWMGAALVAGLVVAARASNGRARPPAPIAPDAPERPAAPPTFLGRRDRR